MKYFLLIAFFYCSLTALKGQDGIHSTSSGEVSMVMDFKTKNVLVEYTTSSEVSNLLLALSDSLSNMVFLDCRHRFKGIYKMEVSLAKQPPGEYTMLFTCDDKRVTRKIFLK